MYLCLGIAPLMLFFVTKTRDKGPTAYMFKVCEHIIMHSHFHKGGVVLNLFQVPAACRLQKKNASQYKRVVYLARVYSVLKKCLRGTKMLEHLLFFVSPASEIQVFQLIGHFQEIGQLDLCLFCGTEAGWVFVGFFFGEITHGYGGDYHNCKRQ